MKINLIDCLKVFQHYLNHYIFCNLNHLCQQENDNANDSDHRQQWWLLCQFTNRICFLFVARHQVLRCSILNKVKMKILFWTFAQWKKKMIFWTKRIYLKWDNNFSEWIKYLSCEAFKGKKKCFKKCSNWMFMRQLLSSNPKKKNHSECHNWEL